MRIAPLVLIVLGTYGLARYFDLIPRGAFHVLGPLLLIAVGVALLFRRPRIGCGGRRPADAIGDGSKASPPVAS